MAGRPVVRIPPKDEYIKAGYPEADYDAFVASLREKAEKDGAVVELRPMNKNERKAAEKEAKTRALEAAGAGAPPSSEEGHESGEESSGEMSFPRSPKSNSWEAVRKEKWKEQGRAKCAQPKCHFPLNFVKNADNQNIPVESPEGPAFKAVCSWDPRHTREGGAEQYITQEHLDEVNKRNNPQ